MNIQTQRSSFYKPINASVTKGAMAPLKGSLEPVDTFDTAKNDHPSPTSTHSNPSLISPSELQELDKPNLSIQKLLLDSFTHSEETQEKQIQYLYEKQAILTQNLLEANKKMVELHKSSSTAPSLLQPTLDIVLPLCISTIALFLGFFPNYPLSKIAAVSTSVIGVAISGLKMAGIEIPSAIPSGYIVLFNLYMAYRSPRDVFTYMTTFLQMLPILSNFFYTVDNNSLQSDEVLAKKVIKIIDYDLKNVMGEVSRAMKTIGEKRKFFSLSKEYAQLQNHIAKVSAA